MTDQPRIVDRVGFHPRAVAFLLDLLLFALMSHIAAGVDYYLNQNTVWSDFGAITVGGAWLTLLTLGLLEAFGAPTPGKRVIRLTIALEDGAIARRRALLHRAAVKYLPVIFTLFPIVTFAVAANSLGMASYVRDGLAALFWIDLGVACGVAAMVIAGCFRAFKPDRQAFHDRVAGTAVFKTTDLLPVRGFTPLLIIKPQQPADANTANSNG